MLPACPVYVCVRTVSRVRACVCVCASRRCAPCLINKGASLSPKLRLAAETERDRCKEPRPPQRQCSQPHTLCPHPAVVTFSSSTPPFAFFSAGFLPPVLSENPLRNSATDGLLESQVPSLGGVAHNAAADL